MERELSSMAGYHRGHQWLVTVWPHPSVVDCYCYAFSIGGGVALANQYPDDPYLHGAYETIGAALEAGELEVMSEINSRPLPRRRRQYDS